MCFNSSVDVIKLRGMAAFATHKCLQGHFSKITGGVCVRWRRFFVNVECGDEGEVPREGVLEGVVLQLGGVCVRWRRFFVNVRC